MSKCYLYLRTSADDRGEKWASRCSGRTAPLRCLSWHGGERQGSRPRSMLGSNPILCEENEWIYPRLSTHLTIEGIHDQR